MYTSAKKPKSQFIWLFIAAIILLFGMLGSREIWTQEHRWADIVSGMFYRHDFLHPYLGENSYYDKPLLSYWLIAVLAWVKGGLSTWSLRIPSALSGLLAIFSIYRLGTKLKDEKFGLLAGWMLLTTFYFLFWARVSSADMMNIAGALFAVSWYFDKRDSARFFDFVVFFLILAVASLCKGLSAAVIALIAIFPDVISENRWKNYLRVSVLLSTIPAAVIYLLPFWASNHFGGTHYNESGLYLVYRENILRYFQPFDHKGPIYTYFIFLPIYLLPWAVFFIPALASLKKRWKNMDASSQWIVWATLLLFLFFTLSGSRRDYYVLPIVPFAILLIADWISSARYFILARRFVLSFFLVMFAYFVVLQPLYLAGGGLAEFATRMKPYSNYQYVLLDPESKMVFYLHLPPSIQNHPVSKDLIQINKKVVYLTRKKYEPSLAQLFKNDFQVVEAKPTLGDRLLKRTNPNLPVAYVPKLA